MSQWNRAGWIVAAVVALVSTPAARAGVVTLSFNASDNSLSTITKTVDGITLTLSNPGPRSTFAADGDGLGLGLESAFLTGADLLSFNLAVTGATLELSNYAIGYVESGTAAAQFTMSGGTGTSAGNPLNWSTSYTANGNWQLAPGQVGTLTASGFTDTGLSQFKTLTFTIVPAAAVPEPGTVGLALVGAGVLGVRAWRRRGVRAAA